MSFFNKSFRFIIFIVLLVIIIKPLILGLYHDDWSTLIAVSYYGDPLSWQRLLWSLKTFASRPVGGIVVYFLSSINGKSAFLWQSSIAFLSIAIIVAQFFFLQRLTSFFEEKQKKIKYVLFAVIFFIYPWAIGGINFVTAGIVVLASLFFYLIAGILILRPIEKLSRKTVFSAGLFYLASCLTYEAMYFQFIFFILFHFLKSLKTKQSIKKTAFVTGALFFSQLLAVGWNRFAASGLELGFAKTFNPEWQSLAVSLIIKAPSFFKQSFFNVPYLFSLLALLFNVNLILLISFLFKKRKQSFYNFLAIFSIIIISFSLSCVLYAVAGYSLAGVGVFSRTTVVQSLFLSFLFFVVDLFFQKTPKILKNWYNASLLMACFILLLVSLERIWDWKQSWDLQKEIVMTAPLEKIVKTGKKDLIVYRGPFETAGVTVFQSWWDIESAVNSRFSNRPDFRRFTVGRDDWDSIWTGEKLIQSWKGDKGSIVWELEADKIWLWNYPQGTFEKILSPGKI